MDCLGPSEEALERAVWRGRRVETISGRAIGFGEEVGLIAVSLESGKRETVRSGGMRNDCSNTSRDGESREV